MANDDLTQRQSTLRRRRAVALAAIAAAALVLGLGVGALTGGAHHHHRRRTLRQVTARATRPRSHTDEAQRENQAISHTLSQTPIVRMAGGQHRELSLTFDDGPGPYTPKILAELRRFHAPATFFEVGAEDQYFSASTARIVAMGDPIGDHTETHAPMSELSPRRQQHEVLQEAAEMGDSGAPFPRLFRAPYGVWDRATLRLLSRYHMLMVLWSVDTDDWERPGVDAIVGSALHGARPGAIILLHDAGGDRSETVTALPRIIRGLRRRGYRLVTVPRLLLDNPAPREQDVASLRGRGG